jgi:hypothetical protein
MKDTGRFSVGQTGRSAWKMGIITQMFLRVAKSF